MCNSKLKWQQHGCACSYCILAFKWDPGRKCRAFLLKSVKYRFDMKYVLMPVQNIADSYCVKGQWDAFVL